MKRYFLMSVLILTAAAGLAQSSAPGAASHDLARKETVSVSGIGKVSLVPDRVTFTLGVQTIAPTVDDAVNQNNAKVAQAIAALKKAGAADKEIRTSNFSIYPQQDYSQGRLPRILGYQVSNNITVTREKVADAGRLLQAAISAGVNQASGLSFLVADPARGRDEALKLAFQDARAKAQTLAVAAGRSIGPALMISEGMQQGYPPPEPRFMAKAAAMSTEAVSDVPVEQGSEEVSYTVSVVFELR